MPLFFISRKARRWNCACSEWEGMIRTRNVLPDDRQFGALIGWFYSGIA